MSARGAGLGEVGGLLETHDQTWGLDRAANRWSVDLFREPSDGDTWICRRDERIRLPYAELIEWTSDGIPYVRPEVVLLVKAKQARPEDEVDLAAVLPRLGILRRRLLADWLALVHPGHFWLPDLAYDPTATQRRAAAAPPACSSRRRLHDSPGSRSP
jgi:hypothetical protein